MLRTNGLFLSLIFTLAFLMSCAGAEEATDDNGSARSSSSGVTRQGGGLTLTAPSADVRTIQLYRTGNESELPVLPLGSGRTLTLRFDLMERSGRTLSVFFYHANRSWRRDLVPSEYLKGFQRDELIDYTFSQATDVPYVHYAYEFPNHNIDFKMSGNFIIRVTEQGMENEVLFERAFFVTEQATALDFGIENVMVAGQGFPSVVPTAQFVPPANIQANVFDYAVCFMRNGNLATPKCTDNPSMAQQPSLRYYLDPQQAFTPNPADYFLDLSDLRISNRIERTNLTTSPYTALLEPDYASFPGSGGIDPLLNGQTVVIGSVRGLLNPEIASEYADVTFSFVPLDEVPITGEIVLTGSFNGWRYDPTNRLTWVEDRRRYEGTVLLKQGHYEYRYMVTDPRTLNALVGAPPRAENLYSAFVYYNDIRVQTDRLLVVTGILTR